MDLARIVFLGSVLICGAIAAPAAAQRTTAQTAPASRVIALPRFETLPVFRSRSVQLRLQAIRDLGGVNVQPSQLMTPFSLTPKTPYVEGRGALLSSNADNLPTGPSTGVLLLLQTSSGVSLSLQSVAPRRYLIQCTVSPGVTVGASAGSGAQTWSAQSTSSPNGANANIASFWTPTLPVNTTISLADAEPATARTRPSFSPYTGTRTPGGTSYFGWALMGCEITPQAP